MLLPIKNMSAGRGGQISVYKADCGTPLQQSFQIQIFTEALLLHFLSNKMGNFRSIEYLSLQLIIIQKVLKFMLGTTWALIAKSSEIQLVIV